MTASLPSMKIGRTLLKARPAIVSALLATATSMLSTGVSGAELLNTCTLPLEPTVTGAEKLKRSGASAQTLAALSGKRPTTVTGEYSSGGATPTPAVPAVSAAPEAPPAAAAAAPPPVAGESCPPWPPPAAAAASALGPPRGGL